MTDLICKLFIKNTNDLKDPNVRRAYGTLSSTVGIILNVLLAIFKLLAGVISASVSITADALNNLSDAGSQVISFISFKISAKPADREHPFGHARIEYVASMIVSFIILTLGVELFKSSIQKVISPEPTRLTILTTIILSVSIIIKLWISIFNRKIGKKINSSVIKATSTDSLADAVSTTAVLVSILISHFTNIATDGYMGILVSVFIFIAGIKILLETKNSILGSAPDPETIEGIVKITSEYPEILGIHDMVVHNYGPGNTIASIHAEVDGAKDVFITHDVIDNYEKRLFTALGVRATVHMDPIVTDDEKITELRGITLSAVKSINESFNIHDFRFVEGKTHSNLIFDISVPFEIKLTDTDIRQMVADAISKINPNYFTVITIDRQ